MSYEWMREEREERREERENDRIERERERASEREREKFDFDLDLIWWTKNVAPKILILLSYIFLGMDGWMDGNDDGSTTGREMDDHDE